MDDKMVAARGEALRRLRGLVSDRRDVAQEKLRDAMFCETFDEAYALSKELRLEVFVAATFAPLKSEMDFLARRLDAINMELAAIGQSPDPVHPTLGARIGTALLGARLK